MTINLGIDLGTTNSAIAYAKEGRIQLFANPRDMGRRTLPSVVGFRKERTIIGTKARERMEKDAQNVFGVFKRKMGTSERFMVPATGKEETPISLSSYVLRELLTFLPSDVSTQAAVITIPASFDTVQSKATEAAGKAAGFQQVSLLQEPIAASLAFANQAGAAVPENGKWLVYDLGGGTFDVALLFIADGEMKVIDHVGDNFLGGTDFDRLIVERIMVPQLEANYSFTNLIEELKSAKGKYNAQFYLLRQRAEEIKIQLSSQ
ncbi:MAG: Hsp70 family protein, partial [Bacteroidota bacterium]